MHHRLGEKTLLQVPGAGKQIKWLFLGGLAGRGAKGLPKKNDRKRNVHYTMNNGAKEEG